MKTDRTTKLLLALIALGLFMNALNPWLMPMPVAAQNQDIAGYLSDIESSVSRIARGACPNIKIC